MGPEKTAISRVLKDYARLRFAVGEAKSWGKRALAQVDQDVGATLLRLQAEASRKEQDSTAIYKAAIQRAADERQRRIVSQVQQPLSQAVDYLGILGAPWSDARWLVHDPAKKIAEKPPKFPGVVRVGSLLWSTGGISVPAMLPILGHRSAIFCGVRDEMDGLALTLQSVVLRLISTFPPGLFRLTLIDPVGVGNQLKMFRRLPEEVRRASIYSDSKEIEAEVKRLLDHVQTITQTRLLDFPTIEQYNAAIGEVAVPYQFLVVANFPAGFSDSAARALLSLAQNGPRTGTYVLASVDEGHPVPHQFSMAELRKHCTVVSRIANEYRWNDPLFSEWPLILDGAPPNDVATDLLNRTSAVSQVNIGKGIPFNKIAIPNHEVWKHDTINGLLVNVGVGTSGKPHQFELGNELVHHALIGGATRMGKTNLLHVLLSQLATAYPPSELQLYMVDFREGVEFQDYVTYNLPHARAIVTATDPEFGLSILTAMQTEIERRGDVFRSVGCTTIKEYRKATGKAMARLLLVMDEFQILFADDGSHSVSGEAGNLLEDIVRRGAAFGIHVLLSSQSPASSFTSNKAAMNQMGLRISLRAPDGDARLILGSSNGAAAFLERPGEAIYNASNGLPEKNIFLQVARFEPEERKRRLQQLQQMSQQQAWRQHMLPERTVVFDATTPATVSANRELLELIKRPEVQPTQASDLRVWLGEAIEIKPHTVARLERRQGANMLIAGANEEVGHSLLCASILSVCAQRLASEARFTVLSLGRSGQAWSTSFFQLSSALPGYEMQIVPVNNVVLAIQELASQVSARRESLQTDAGDHILIIAGFDRLDQLRETDKYGQPGETATHIADILVDGPPVGVHTIAWTGSFVSLDRNLGRRVSGALALRVALKMSTTEASAFFGSQEPSRLADRRALFRDDMMGGTGYEKFKPYSPLAGDQLHDIRSSIAIRKGRKT